MKTGYSN